jgi:hypothetical protein
MHEVLGLIPRTTNKETFLKRQFQLIKNERVCHQNMKAQETIIGGGDREVLRLGHPRQKASETPSQQKRRTLPVFPSTGRHR